MFDLLFVLPKFEPANDHENENAFFRTHVPFEAPAHSLISHGCEFEIVMSAPIRF
jgi:hypothetical protein